MSLSNSQLFSVNILSALEADDLDNPDPEDTEFCQLILEWGFPQKIAELKGNLQICHFIFYFILCNSSASNNADKFEIFDGV